MSTPAAASAPASLTSRIGAGAGMVAVFGPLLGWIAFAFLLAFRGPDSGTTDALGSLLCWLARAFARAAELRGRSVRSALSVPGVRPSGEPLRSAFRGRAAILRQPVSVLT